MGQYTRAYEFYIYIRYACFSLHLQRHTFSTLPVSHQKIRQEVSKERQAIDRQHSSPNPSQKKAHLLDEQSDQQYVVYTVAAYVVRPVVLSARKIHSYQ